MERECRELAWVISLEWLARGNTNHLSASAHYSLESLVEFPSFQCAVLVDANILSLQHPYSDNMNVTYPVKVPGAQKFFISFDAQTATEQVRSRGQLCVDLYVYLLLLSWLVLCQTFLLCSLIYTCSHHIMSAMHGCRVVLYL